MRTHFVDCFMLMGTALSLRGDQKLPEMGRPLLQDVFTTTVNISITLSQIYFENVNDMEVRFTFLLHQRWLDPRLGANQRTRKLAVSGQIWRPHITSTEGDAYVKENDMTQYWRGMGPEGNILYSEKVTVKTFCTTNFRKFPFDSQKCAIKLGSYRFPKEEVELTWNTIPIEILTGTDLKEFKLTDVNTYSEVEVRPSGNFTVLVAQITVKRFYEHYIFCTIAPCSLIVVVSYFVFWLNPRNITIRHFLSGINLCLLIYYYHYSACATMVVPYMKALDVFIAICLSFVFMGLLENFAIDVIFRKEDFEEYGSRIFHKIPKSVYGTKYKLLDRIACAMYPIIFTCVMLFFCIMYVS